MNLHNTLSDLTGGVIIKLPAAYDIAGSYEQVANWRLIDPKPLIVFHKATEGNFYKDPKLAVDFLGMSANGIARGAYHFHRKAVSAIEQARYFCNYITGTIQAADKLVLDMEEGGETPQQIIDWLDEVERKFDNEILIYSRKNILDPLVAKCTTPQLNRLEQYRLWIAGYPYFPNLYDSIPAGYVPAKLGPVIVWQYSENGQVTGVTGEVDLDWLAPEFIAELQGHTPQPPPITDGYQQIRRNDSDIHLWRGQPTKIHVTDNKGMLIRPSNYAGSQAHIIINGDGWLKDADITYHKPLSLAWSDGSSVQEQQYDLRPYFRDVGTGYQIAHSYPAAPYNLVSGTRYLVIGGENFFANDTDPEHVTELQPRTAIGYTQDGRLIACVVDGRSTASAGVTLKQLADILIEAGAWYALELDGGDSSIMLVDGSKVSHNGDLINGVRTERATVNSVLIYTKDLNMANYYRITATDSNNHTIRADKVITAGAVGSFKTGDEVRAGATPDDVYIYPENVPLATGATAWKGDKWRKVYEKNGAALVGWTAEIHRGVIQAIKVELVQVAPPPVSTQTFDVKLTDNETGKTYSGTLIEDV